MKFYFFGGDFFILEKLYDSKFDGALFLYNANANEFFTTISHNHQRIRPGFKYMVAIRPYVISPQYLAMIHRNLYHLLGDILQINLVSGWTKPEEAPYNSFVGNINDSSSSIEKSKYLIEYLNSLNELKNNVKNIKNNKTEDQLIKETIPDVYVSATNKFVFNAALKNDNKIILPYHTYFSKKFHSDVLDGYNDFHINNKKIFITLTPIIRDTKEELADFLHYQDGNDVVCGTAEDIVEILKKIKSDGIEGVLLFAWDDEREPLFRFMATYKDLI